MAYLNWNNTLSVNIESIDKQHQKLIDLINDFYDNLQKRQNKENIVTLIAGMKDYTCKHFMAEERLMKQHAYPDYEAHKCEHDAFIAKVTDLETRHNKGTLIVSFEITSFLKDWLKNHIQGVDKKYSDFFIQNGVK
jgi:hemerythrin